MAKITIELNTDIGDTLFDVIGKLQMKEFERWITHTIDRSRDGNGAAFGPMNVKSSVDDKVTTPMQTSVRFTGGDIDPNGKFPEPATGTTTIPPVTLTNEPPLTDMDGDRKRGEAGPGHRRRTNAQIDDDKRYLDQRARAEAALAAMDKGVHLEERVNADPDDSHIAFTNPDDAPQDAADEAAETAARPQGPPTLEDLRAAIVRYTDKFGAAASVKNMRGILGCGVEQVKEDDIPAAIFKLEHLIRDGGPQTENPGGRYVVTGQTGVEAVDLGGLAKETAAPPTASKADFVEAFKAYARKYDGSDDSSDNGRLIPVTKEDVTKIFAATFGEGTTNLLNIPGGQTPEAFGKIVAAIKQATEDNAFKREVKS